MVKTHIYEDVKSEITLLECFNYRVMLKQNNNRLERNLVIPLSEFKDHIISKIMMDNGSICHYYHCKLHMHHARTAKMARHSSSALRELGKLSVVSTSLQRTHDTHHFYFMQLNDSVVSHGFVSAQACVCFHMGSKTSTMVRVFGGLVCPSIHKQGHTHTEMWKDLYPWCSPQLVCVHVVRHTHTHVSECVCVSFALLSCVDSL